MLVVDIALAIVTEHPIEFTLESNLHHIAFRDCQRFLNPPRPSSNLCAWMDLVALMKKKDGVPDFKEVSIIHESLCIIPGWTFRGRKIPSYREGV